MRAGAGSTKSGIQVVSTPYCTCYHRGNSGTGSTVTTKFALPLLRNFREIKHFGLLFFLFIFFFFFFFLLLLLFSTSWLSTVRITRKLIRIYLPLCCRKETNSRARSSALIHHYDDSFWSSTAESYPHGAPTQRNDDEENDDEEPTKKTSASHGLIPYYTNRKQRGLYISECVRWLCSAARSLL